MLKAGFIQKWKADFWPSQDRCSSTAYGGAGRQKKVDLEDMQGSFYLLLLGEESAGYGRRVGRSMGLCGYCAA